jgi:hypothetical protein
LWARAAVAVGKARAAAVAVVAAAAARARAAAAARAAEAWAAEAWAATTTAVRAAAAGWGGGVGWGVRGLPHRHVPRCRNGVVIDSAARDCYSVGCSVGPPQLQGAMCSLVYFPFPEQCKLLGGGVHI